MVDKSKSKQKEEIESLRKQSNLLRKELSVFLLNGEVDYLEQWAFEYACQLTERLNMRQVPALFEYATAFAQYDMFKRYLAEVRQFSLDNKDKDYEVIEVTLPSYNSIPYIIEEKIRLTDKNHGRTK